MLAKSGITDGTAVPEVLPGILQLYTAGGAVDPRAISCGSGSFTR